MIHEFSEKIKTWWEAHQNDFFLLVLIVLLSAIFFGAGRLWLAGFYEVEPRKIVIEKNAFQARPKQGLGQARFMASINGEKYYPVGCKAANRINKENIIWFASEKEARDMGYTPSAQC